MTKNSSARRGIRPPAVRWEGLVAAVMLMAGTGWAPAAAEGVDLAGAEAGARVSPGDLQALLALGAAYYEADSLDQAVAVFQRAVAIDSTSVPALVNLGVTLIDLNRAEEAVAVLERALTLRPADAAILANLGIGHYAAGRTEEAVGLLQQAIALDPGNPLAHFHLGIAFAQAQLYEEAVREWEAVIAAGPETSAGKQALDNIERIKGIYRAERRRNQQETLLDRQ